MPATRQRIPTKTEGQYHHGDLKGALLAAALEMLDEEGPSAVSTRALARRLGVSHAAPARHFPDRAFLLAEVAAAAFEAFAQALEAGRAQSTRPVESFAAMGRAYVRFAMEHPGYFRLMFSHELSQFETIPERLSAASSRAHQVLVQGVRALAGPRASDEKIQQAAFTAWAEVHGAATLWLDGPLRHSLPPRGAAAAFLRMADAAVDTVSRALATS